MVQMVLSKKNYSIILLKQKLNSSNIFQQTCTTVMKILQAMDTTNIRSVIIEYTQKKKNMHVLIINMHLIDNLALIYCNKQIHHLDFLQQDVQLMANMGLDPNRFSISWSRLIPGKIFKYMTHKIKKWFLLWLTNLYMHA
jgi:hypothetical protein